MDPKDAHTLIPGICEYGGITWQRDLAGGTIVMGFTLGGYSGISSQAWIFLHLEEGGRW